MSMQIFNKIPWVIVIALCATLGLAPFNPPHLVEKLAMLADGQLSRPVDIFDLMLHATPWILLILKGAALLATRDTEASKDQ